MQISIFNHPTLKSSTAAELPDLLNLPEPTVIWIDSLKGEKAALDLMRDLFHFHPVAIEDTVNHEQRPKLEEYSGYLFMIVNPLRNLKNQLEFHELDIFVGRNYVFTVRDEQDGCAGAVQKRLQQMSAAQINVSHLVYQLLDVIVDDYFPIIEQIENEIEELEDHILLTPKQHMLKRIFELKRNLTYLWHVVWPQRDMVSRLSQPHIMGFGDNNAAQYYMRDVSDHLLWITDLIGTFRDTLTNMIDLYMSAQSNRLSRVVNRLTVITLGFGVTAVITGFYGMNFLRTMPAFEEPMGILFVVALMFIVAVVTVIILWRVDRYYVE